MFIFSSSSIYSNRGQLLVEILITMGLFAMLAPALLTGFVASKNSRLQQENYTAATSQLKEIQDAVRLVREKGWASFAVNGTYHPVLTNGVWSLAAGSDVKDNFTRTILVSDVYRNSVGAIVATGSADPSTKKITTTITWDIPRISSISTTEYLTRYLDNLVNTESTEADFIGTSSNASGSATANVKVKSYGGSDNGHVELSGISNGDWCNPNTNVVAQMNLSSSGAARDVKAIQGKAYTGTNTGGGTFVQVGITDTDPPVLSTVNSLSGYETKDVFIDGSYAYVATADTDKDVVIINLSTNQEVGYFNPSNPSFFGIPLTAQGVYVVGNVGYVTIGTSLYTFNLTSKTGSRPEYDHICLSNFFCLASAYRFVVNGNYAYVSVDWGSAELQLVNVSNPSNLSLAGAADVNGSRGQEVTLNSNATRAYLATSQDSGKREMFIINTTSKTGSLPIVGSYESNGMSPRGIALVANNRVVLAGTGAEEYQVVDITNESSPSRCGGLNIDNGVYGLDSVLESDNQAYTYVVTGDSTNEFKAILGGPGGSGTKYGPTGTYESKIFDATSTTAFNRIDASLYIPNLTTLTYQVAVASASAGSCVGASYTYLGPDGTSSTSYTALGGPIPFKTANGYSNPGRCLRYKASFTSSDTATSSALNDVRINYSP